MSQEAPIQAVVVDLTADNLEKQVRALLDKIPLAAPENTEALRVLLLDPYPHDIADIIERLQDQSQRYTLFGVLTPDMAAKVIVKLAQPIARLILNRLSVDSAASLLSRMAIDDIVKALAVETQKRQTDILANMLPETAQEIRGLLAYPPLSAGRLMTDKFVRVAPDMTAAEIIAFLRRNNAQYETVTDVYVLDPDQRLIGVASLRDVINAEIDQKIGTFMQKDPTSVLPTQKARVAARILGRYDFLALPVVTPDKVMLGIITVDDAIEVLTRAQTKDLIGIGGMGGEAASEPYFSVPIFQVIRQRFVWLVFLFVAGFVTSYVLSVFQNELETVVALTFYIPLLIGTGGNTGSQTVSMVIRGMTTNDIRQSDIWRVVQRELISGVILGLMLGAVALLRVILSDGLSTALPFVVATAVIAVCAWSNVIASVIPLLAKRFKIDPALISAPLISTTVDATGLLIYIGVAKLLLDVI